mmetsp:Transcript_11783/g.23490  ORF Transcript_11783/g.23490 Transcript_11783/m.23490 type:complete len:219 (+) Transcript_11783:202-858(+)|eukprot:CAMPEP_0194348208 /NCGR_PEP_ID=MMETSP0171-20130528/106411_1 /TAXON_ID=218684 /ORGANISM="Corethron pennatum, Strain L29A3" /LENGTH=218 /DNA_ID=CAMNT_0039115533 /DNA_START=2202 /DNA_END=2858 /DNA_ORIENTATION=+
MPTLITDPRSGGVKKSSGVNVLPIVAEIWAQVRSDGDPITYLIAGFDGTSKTDVTVISKGEGGIEGCAGNLPVHCACWGGCRLSSGRFVTFYYVDEGTSPMQKGRASMYKNGVLNVLEGSDTEVDMRPGLREEDIVGGGENGRNTVSSGASTAYVEEIPSVSNEITDPVSLPHGVDPLHREQALSDSDFINVFGMDKASFNALPAWKRTSKKKVTGFF